MSKPTREAPHARRPRAGGDPAPLHSDGKKTLDSRLRGNGGKSKTLEPLSPAEGASFPSPSGRRWPEGPDEGSDIAQRLASPEPSPLPLSRRERGSKAAGSRHSGESRTAEAGCRSERSRSERPEGRAAGATRNPLSSSSFPRRRESSDFAPSEPWPTETIGNLFTIGAGKSVTPQSRAQEPKAPFLRTSNVFWGRIDINNVDTMYFTPEELAAKTLLPGDLLVCEGGDIGRSAIWNGELERCSFQNHLHRLRPKLSDVVSHFFMYYLQAGFTQLGIYEGAGNKTTIPNLSRNRLALLNVALPPKPEQQKIAAVLWKLQRATTTQDRLIAATRDLKQSAMQQLFTHGLRGEALKDTAIGPMPASWRVSDLSGVAHLARGRFTHRPRNEPRFYGGETPFVQTGDVVRSQGLITKYTQTLNAEGVAISRVFPKGTILITIAANIGFIGILDFDSACPDSLVGITPNEAMDTQFLAYYLQLQQPEMDQQAPKGTQKNINIQFLQPWPVVVPSIDEQRDIAAALATLDRKLAHHQKKRAALNDLFQTLLHKLMTAQIRVADLDIDTSEVTTPQPQGVAA